MAMEVEDDVLFAELSKQIARLIMEDDEEEFPVKCPSLPVQGFPCMPQTIMPPPYGYELAYRRESKGTGVFIPRSTLPRRKNKSGRSIPDYTNSHKHPHKQGVAVSDTTTKNHIYSSYYINPAVLKTHK
ncbi:uncharacterized protein LOC103709446 [Phoenix dactylifera]|uniref:Uncharacterized protein LOC103709446 n=1 Tax=Phoenix dactylifera TaxID=42345 RepID=A0A8B7C6W2_PHODC|nr:uncharacterized protein LOC103709446 [Phoenix dactylifera]